LHLKFFCCKWDNLYIPTGKNPMVTGLNFVAVTALVRLFQLHNYKIWHSGPFMSQDWSGKEHRHVDTKFHLFLLVQWHRFVERSKCNKHIFVNDVFSTTHLPHHTLTSGGLTHTHKFYMAISVHRSDSCACLYDHSWGRLPHLWTSCAIKIVNTTNSINIFCMWSMHKCARACLEKLWVV